MPGRSLSLSHCTYYRRLQVPFTQSQLRSMSSKQVYTPASQHSPVQLAACQPRLLRVRFFFGHRTTGDVTYGEPSEEDTRRFGVAADDFDRVCERAKREPDGPRWFQDKWLGGLPANRRAVRDALDQLDRETGETRTVRALNQAQMTALTATVSRSRGALPAHKSQS